MHLILWLVPSEISQVELLRTSARSLWCFQGAIIRPAKGGGGTAQRWPSSLDNNPTYEGGSLRIQRLPPTGSGISPPERHTSSRASVDRLDASHLVVTHTHSITQNADSYWMIHREVADLPLRLKYCAENLPDKATAGGTLPSSSIIWAMWSEVDEVKEKKN